MHEGCGLAIFGTLLNRVKKAKMLKLGVSIPRTEQWTYNEVDIAILLKIINCDLAIVRA